MKQPFCATDTISRLEQKPERIPWSERQTMAKAVAEELERGSADKALIGLLYLLAEDPKWEVRKDVADCLLLIDDDEFPKLATRLSQDDNEYVRKSAARALDRRRRGQESDRRKRRGLDHIQEQYDRIETEYGSVAAQRARALAEQLYDLLVGTTVHDMRNFLLPLKSATSCLSGHLRDGNLDSKVLKKNFHKMERQIEMIERMLEDMRRYAQPTPLSRRRERLAELVHEAHADVLETFHATGRDASCVTANIDVPQDLTVDVARADMVRAIMNIIKNAYESHAASPETFTPGSIWVTARPCDTQRIELTFRDDGMGLSPDELAEVRRFMPGNTSKRMYGTGFGLPTAKRKIEAHGGSIAMDSQVDKGTTVTVTLSVESRGKEHDVSCPGSGR